MPKDGIAAGFRTIQEGQQQMSDEVSPPPRFLVREGCKGWMVYDRQRKGPAMVGTDPAVNLTEELAGRIKLALVAKQEHSP